MHCCALVKASSKACDPVARNVTQTRDVRNWRILPSAYGSFPAHSARAGFNSGTRAKVKGFQRPSPTRTSNRDSRARSRRQISMSETPGSIRSRITRPGRRGAIRPRRRTRRSRPGNLPPRDCNRAARQIRIVVDDQDARHGNGAGTDNVLARLIHQSSPRASVSMSMSMSISCRLRGRLVGRFEPVTR